MTSLEILFLAVVCGAFGTFSVAMIAGTLRYKAFVRDEALKDHEARY